MKPEVAEIWCNALESGEYNQCQDMMFDSEDGYCCLGVLTKLAIDAGIETSLYGMYPDKTVQNWAGLKSKDGSLSVLNDYGLDVLNDGKKGFAKTGFKEIAQVIRGNVDAL